MPVRSYTLVAELYIHFHNQVGYTRFLSMEVPSLLEKNTNYAISFQKPMAVS